MGTAFWHQGQTLVVVSLLAVSFVHCVIQACVSFQSKLVKLFSDQLVAKARLATDEVPEQLSDFPKTGLWLLVAGVSKDALSVRTPPGLGGRIAKWLECPIGAWSVADWS